MPHTDMAARFFVDRIVHVPALIQLLGFAGVGPFACSKISAAVEHSVATRLADDIEACG